MFKKIKINRKKKIGSFKKRECAFIRMNIMIILAELVQFFYSDQKLNKNYGEVKGCIYWIE